VRVSGGHPLTRLLTLLELLQAYRRLSGSELARRLEVAPRTVRRYVSTLKEIGIPVDAEVGRYGGYLLRPGYKLPPLMLTEDETLAVVLGLLAGRRLGLVVATSAVEGALAKLDRVLPDALRARVRGTQEAVGLGLTAESGTGDRFVAGLLLELGAAAHDRRRVRISYRARNGQTTERTVDPYGVVFQSGRWYLAGWDHLRQAARTFRLDRVQATRVTDMTFDRPKSFDPLTYVQQSIATAPGVWSVEALLELSPQQARSRVSPTLGTLEQRRDGMLLRLSADDLNWAARYLVGLDCRFKVHQPPQLREALGRLASELAADAAKAEGGAGAKSEAPPLTDS
jgi:predicted DNA-binding transcriptional regulator YafY